MTETTEKIVPNAGYKCKLDARHRKDVHYQMNKNFGAAKVAYNWCRKEHLRRYHEDWMPVRDEKIKELQEKYTEVVSDEDNFKKFTKSYRSIMKNYKKEKSVLKQKLKELRGEYDNSDSFFSYLSEYDEFFKATSDLRKQPSAKEFRQFVKENEDFSWIKEADSKCIDDAIYVRYSNAYSKFIDGTAKKRKLKKGKIARYPQDYGFPSYQDKIDSYQGCLGINPIIVDKHQVKIPKVKRPINICHSRELPEGDFTKKYVTFSTDGIDYFVSFKCFKEVTPLSSPQSPILGVDTGLENLATLSDGTVVTNPSVTDKVQKLFELQRKVDRAISKARNAEVARQENLTGNKLTKKEAGKIHTYKMRKLERKSRRIRIKINDFMESQMKLTAYEIVMTNPKGIIFKKEDNQNDARKKVGGKKGKNIARKKQLTPISKFKSILANAAKRRGIPVKETADVSFVLNTCSFCGYTDESRALCKDKVFICPQCGQQVPRAVNVSNNLETLWGVAKDI